MSRNEGAVADKPLTEDEYFELLARGQSPNLEEFRRMREYDPTVIWRLTNGDLENVLDKALDTIEQLQASTRGATSNA